MSTRIQRVIRDNYNHGFGDLGDVKPLTERRPHEVEDRLLAVLHDCICGPNPSIRSVNIRPFREWLRGPDPARVGWNETNRQMCIGDDTSCEATIYFTAATLRRLSHLHEWAVNWLMRNGVPLEMLPQGDGYLGG